MVCIFYDVVLSSKEGQNRVGIRHKLHPVVSAYGNLEWFRNCGIVYLLYTDDGIGEIILEFVLIFSDQGFSYGF